MKTFAEILKDRVGNLFDSSTVTVRVEKVEDGRIDLHIDGQIFRVSGNALIPQEAPDV